MLRRSLAQGLICAMFMLMLAGCTASSVPGEVLRTAVPRNTQPQPVPGAVSELVHGNNEFAFDLYRHVTAEAQDDNLIFSPYSISQAFAMVYAGARGDTEREIAEVMHFTLPQEELHPAFNALDLRLQPIEEETQPTATPTDWGYIPQGDLVLKVANSTWAQQGFNIEQAFLETLALDYGAEMNMVDFAANPDDARSAINQWTSDATEGRIDEIVSPDMVHSNTRLVLVNAVYFKGDWTWPFQVQGTHARTFHRLDGSEMQVSMMVNGFAFMLCGRGENYHAIGLTYGALEDAEMVIVLPDEGQFEAVNSSLNANSFAEIRSSIQSTNMMTLTMPRFGFESEIDLMEVLQSMGMAIPFSSGADFSGIAPGLFIGAAAHKATISVDEQGTEASAATSIAMLEEAAMSECGSEIIVDRPFIFAIYDTNTKAILFLGQVLEPVE